MGHLGVSITVNPAEEPAGPLPNPELPTTGTATILDFRDHAVACDIDRRLGGKTWHALLTRFMDEQNNPPEHRQYPPSELVFYKSIIDETVHYNILGLSSLANYLCRIDLAIVAKGEVLEGIHSVTGPGVGRGYVKFWRTFLESRLPEDQTIRYTVPAPSLTPTH